MKTNKTLNPKEGKKGKKSKAGEKHTKPQVRGTPQTRQRHETRAGTPSPHGTHGLKHTCFQVRSTIVGPHRERQAHNTGDA